MATEMCNIFVGRVCVTTARGVNRRNQGEVGRGARAVGRALALVGVVECLPGEPARAGWSRCVDAVGHVFSLICVPHCLTRVVKLGKVTVRTPSAACSSYVVCRWAPTRNPRA